MCRNIFSLTCAVRFSEERQRRIIQSKRGFALVKVLELQWSWNRAAPLALNCNRRTSTIRMHRTLGWSLVKNRLLTALLCFIRNITLSKIANVLYHQFSCSMDVDNFNTRRASKACYSLRNLMQGNVP